MNKCRVYSGILFFAFCFFISICVSCKSTFTNEMFIPESEFQGKKIVFYRDDCKDCWEVFPKLYFRNLVIRDTVFVNLNEALNKELYNKRYCVNTVPTIIDND